MWTRRSPQKMFENFYPGEDLAVPDLQDISPAMLQSAFLENPDDWKQALRSVANKN